MPHRVLGIVLAFTAVFMGSSGARAQFIPDKFTNLKVLPTDISKQELTQTMRGFAFALDVRCEHCHVEKKAPEQGFDFAADDKKEKKTARVMLQMVAAINHDYISKVPAITQEPKEATVQVQCVTCHHGLAQPRTLHAVLSASLDKDGLEKTVTLYNELRAKYYGGAQYDFGETTLNQLTESLLVRQKKAEALAIEELNFSANHPDSVWSYHMLAQTHQANGQIDKAIADYRKVLELHPDDRWAKEQLDSLSGKK